MKAVFTLIAVLAVVCLGVYFFGGYRSFDPSEQGRSARAALQTGMTWTQVIDITGEPSQYHPILQDLRVGPPNKFTRDGIAGRLAENSLPDGFVCVFVYSSSVVFRAEFDGAGNLISVEDGVTMARLLQLND